MAKSNKTSNGKTIYRGGYSIYIREANKAQGLYELSAMVNYGGEEYRERMFTYTPDDTAVDKFIRQIEHNK